MSADVIEVSAQIDNTPEAVLAYVADVRNRPYYLAPLRSVTLTKEAPDHGAGTSWRWTWVALGMEFEGTGTCLRYEPGKLYSFRTEGGISSTWTYTAEPADGGGTKLTIKVEYEVPESARSRLPLPDVAQGMKRTEAQRVVQNLKHILDR